MAPTMKHRARAGRRLLIAVVGICLALGLVTGLAMALRTAAPAHGAGHGQSGSRLQPAQLASPAANAVLIQGFAFVPAVITVTTGSTITWTNMDEFGHTTTSNSGEWDSEQLAFRDTFTHTFTTAGTFSYFCAIHPGMQAQVVVQNAAPELDHQLYLPVVGS